MSWHYEQQPPNEGINGGAYRGVFNGSGKSHAENLAREAIQNSVDAALPGTPKVRIDFAFSKLEGDDLAEFEQVTRMDDIRERKSKLGLGAGNFLSCPQKQGGKDRSLSILTISDYGTTGLQGDPTDRKSKFWRLLKNMGSSGSQSGNTGGGGAYGYGKSVYISNSRVGLIHVFSHTMDHKERPLDLLMGAAYHADHTHDGVDHTGRAFLGLATEVGNGTRYDPFTDKDARDMAKAMRIHRNDGPGTTIMIVDTPLSADDLVAGVENWWWPRIEDNKLDISITARDGTEMVPKPRSRIHLCPFIKARDNAQGKAPDMGSHLKYNDIPVGTLGAKVLDNVRDQEPLGQDHDHMVNTAALIRGPGMVVDYKSILNMSRSGPVIVGAFTASPEINEILRLSEPPTHSQWDHQADRLRPDEQKTVKNIMAKIAKGMRDFQHAAKPPPSANAEHLDDLGRNVSKWFKAHTQNASGGAAKRPEPNPAPISMRLPNLGTTEENGKLRLRGMLEISQRDDAEEDESQFEARLNLRVLEDGTPTDRIALNTTPPPPLEQTEQGFWRGSVGPGETLRIKFISEPYDPDWTVEFAPEARNTKENDQ